jgi:ketosteroid isomerase-like protein
MSMWKASTVLAIALAARSTGHAQAAPGLQAAAAQIIKADADFAQSVADKNHDRFLSFLADITTFSGGTPDELHGKDAVWTAWADFFAPDGPSLTWTPTKGEVIGAGDIGYTTGASVFRARRADGTVSDRRGQYLTVWKKQPDGTWRVIFDTGSTLP